MCVGCLKELGDTSTPTQCAESEKLDLYIGTRLFPPGDCERLFTVLATRPRLGLHARKVQHCNVRRVVGLKTLVVEVQAARRVRWWQLSPSLSEEAVQ